MISEMSERDISMKQVISRVYPHPRNFAGNAVLIRPENMMLCTKTKSFANY